jgi:hypothetical protein
MVAARRVVVSLVVFVTAASAQPATPPSAPAKATVPPLVGATEVAKFTTPAGFIDDPVATDDQRLAYVIADGTAKAELHVVALATPSAPDTVVDVSAITSHPIALRLVGPRAFVVGATEDGNQIAALVELVAPSKTKPAGTAVYKLGPATHITVITRDGRPRIAVHRATATPAGTRHEVELVALDTGKRIAAGRPFELDASQIEHKLEFRVNHWADGMTRAIGIKGGEWDKKENQRTPDAEATYDLVTSTVTDRRPIQDLFEQRKRYQALADAASGVEFVRMAWDNTGVQVWRAGKPTAFELDQPITNYDPKSLQGFVLADGSAWFSLKIDPVNTDAVARQKADPEYLDVFRAGNEGKAIRKLRVLAKATRYRFGLVGDKTGDRLWLLERPTGFDRGGRSLALFKLTP